MAFWSIFHCIHKYIICIYIVRYHNVSISFTVQVWKFSRFICVNLFLKIYHCSVDVILFLFWCLILMWFLSSSFFCWPKTLYLASHLPFQCFFCVIWTLFSYWFYTQSWPHCIISRSYCSYPSFFYRGSCSWMHIFYCIFCWRQFENEWYCLPRIWPINYYCVHIFIHNCVF